MIDGFHFIHLLRLRNQIDPACRPEGANRIDPRRLNDLDRHVLKEAFRQARRLQARLVREYELAT
jgi:CBS domain-containing protein